MSNKPFHNVRHYLIEIITSVGLVQRLKAIWGISLFSNAFYLMMRSVVDSLVGFVFWIIAARLYTPQEVGLASATISIIALLGFLSMVGVNWGLMRYLPDSGNKTRDLINSSFTITALAALAFSIVFLGGLGTWSPALILLRQNWILAGVFIASTIAFTIISMVVLPFIARKRSGFALAVTIIFGLSRLGLLIPLAVWFPNLGIFAAWGFGMIIAVTIAVPFLLPRVERGYRLVPTIKRKVIGKIVRYSGANYAAELLMIIPINILPLMVVNVLGAESNAYFYIAWSLGGLFTLIGAGISVALFAEGATDESTLSQNIKSSFKAFILFIPLFLIVFSLGDKILLLFGREYSNNATQLLWVVAACALPISINHIYFAVKRVQKQMKGVIGLNASIVIFALLLSYFLLPEIGILGVGIAWLIIQSIVALITGRWLYIKFLRRPHS